MAPSKGFQDIEVELDDEDVITLVAGGLLELREDGVFGLTPKGQKWMDEWLRGKLGDQVPTKD